MLLVPGQARPSDSRPSTRSGSSCLGDTDLDGRLSLDEYREQLRASPRMKNAAATIEPLFRRLDSGSRRIPLAGGISQVFPQRPGEPATNPDTSKEKRPARTPQGG